MICDHYTLLTNPLEESMKHDMERAWVNKILTNDDYLHILSNLTNINTKPFEKESRIKVSFTGPDQTAYAKQHYEIDIDIPFNYP